MNLKINDKSKEFKINFISAKMLKRTIELQKKAENTNLDESILDEIVGYIVEIYGNRFSMEEFYDGIDVADIFPTFQDAVTTVMDRFQSKIKSFPNE